MIAVLLALLRIALLGLVLYGVLCLVDASADLVRLWAQIQGAGLVK